MKKLLLSLLSLACVLVSLAQESGKNNGASNGLRGLKTLDLGPQGIGFGLESLFGHSTTINLSAGIGGGYDIWTDELNYRWDLSNQAIYFSVNPRFYYNLKKRANKGKSTINNSGNYFGFRVKYTTRALGEAGNVWDALLGNIHWGMQRPLGKRWLFNGHIGVGYAIDATDLSNSFGTFYPATELRFAYVLNR